MSMAARGRRWTKWRANCRRRGSRARCSGWGWIRSPAALAAEPAASGAITSFMDRVFFSAGGKLRGKPAACVASARRAGTTATLDQLNKYFYICGLPIVPSQYWPMVHGTKAEDVAQDAEGLQIMRTLAKNMAWMIKCIAAGKAAGITLPELEPVTRTNFIR